MKRVLVLAAAGLAAIAVALPATAAAAKFQGVVLTKKPARHAVVTASRNGVVRTTRVRGSLARFRAGRIVAVQAAELPDGTYAASKIRLLGKTRLTRLRGSVVAASSKSLVVSAGMSVLSLVFRGSASALHPGDAVVVGASVSGAVLKTTPNRVRKVGHDGTLELEGIYLATGDDGTIELAVEHRGRVFVHVPSDLVVPDFQAGDEIALTVRVEADGSFTLIKADDESGDDDGDGGHTGGDRFTVAGVLTELTHAEVGVAIDGRASRMARCAVPDGFDLTGFETRGHVYMTCKYGGGHRVLVSLRKQTGSEYLVAIGHILDLGDGTITVQGDGDPIQCAVPDDFDLSEFDLGDPVVMSCLKVDGAWTLRALQKRDLPPPPPTVTITGHITALDEVDDFTVTVQGEHDPLSSRHPRGGRPERLPGERRGLDDLPRQRRRPDAEAPPVGDGHLGRRLPAAPASPASTSQLRGGERHDRRAGFGVDHGADGQRARHVRRTGGREPERLPRHGLRLDEVRDHVRRPAPQAPAFRDGALRGALARGLGLGLAHEHEHTGEEAQQRRHERDGRRKRCHREVPRNEQQQRRTTSPHGAPLPLDIHIQPDFGSKVNPLKMTQAGVRHPPTPSVR